MKNMQNHYVNGIDARSLMAKIPLFMKLCSFLLLINVSVAFASASNSRTSLSSESIMQSGITVTGTVVDTEGLTMPGVNIIVKGTTTGVITDIDGNFRISVPDKNSVLVFSFVGYTAQDIVVGNQTNIKVTLQADALELEDVVVVGYGVQKKKLVTGATSQVKGEDITIYGDGKQTRSFQYVDDLVEGMVRMMASENFTGPVNLGNPGEFTMLELAEIILKMTNSKSKIIFTPLPSDDPKQRKPDITLAKEKLNGWEPKIRLEEGLIDTIKYFKSL